jgi:UDP-glucose 4-epimerase
MTRFLLTLDQAADTVFAALRDAAAGETYVPQVPAAKVVDIAAALIANRRIKQTVTGIRPGEKVHEILVSEEEAHRTVIRDPYFAILPMLPELRPAQATTPGLQKEYSSADNLMTAEQARELLQVQRLMVDDAVEGAELLR